MSPTHRVRATSGSSQRPVNRPSVAYCHGVHAHGSGMYSTHSPMMTRPGDVADLIISLATR